MLEVVACVSGRAPVAEVTLEVADAWVDVEAYDRGLALNEVDQDEEAGVD